METTPCVVFAACLHRPEGSYDAAYGRLSEFDRGRSHHVPASFELASDVVKDGQPQQRFLLSAVRQAKPAARISTRRPGSSPTIGPPSTCS